MFQNIMVRELLNRLNSRVYSAKALNLPEA